jgi:hypothetical protein
MEGERMEREQASTVRNYDETPTWISYGGDQAVVEQWVRTRFGDKVFESLEERALRVLEEGVELFDSEAKDREAARAKAHKLVDAVFDKAKGEQNQEAGGVIVTLLAYCAAKGLRLDKLADDEIARIQKLPVEHFRKRQQAKADAGVAAPPG